MSHLDESYALVSYVIKLASHSGKLGKKAAQKFVHIITSIGGVPSKYEFQLYTYGPFSRELAGDLDILESVQAVSIQYNAEKNSYEIQPGSRSDELISRHSKFIDANKSRIDELISRFGGRLARQLELSSTLLFVIDRDLVDNSSDDEQVIKKFSEIKPHYSRSEIKPALAELRQLLQ